MNPSGERERETGRRDRREGKNGLRWSRIPSLFCLFTISWNPGSVWSMGVFWNWFLRLLRSSSFRISARTTFPRFQKSSLLISILIATFISCTYLSFHCRIGQDYYFFPRFEFLSRQKTDWLTDCLRYISRRMRKGKIRVHEEAVVSF